MAFKRKSCACHGVSCNSTEEPHDLLWEVALCQDRIFAVIPWRLRSAFQASRSASVALSHQRGTRRDLPPLEYEEPFGDRTDQLLSGTGHAPASR